MMLKKIGKIAFFFFAAAAWADAPPKFTVVASPNPLAENDSLQLRMEVITQGTAQIYRPEFNAADFTAVGSGFSGGTSSIMENGSILLEKRAIYTFVLFPKKKGLLKISDISVRVGSETLTTPDMVIKVLEDAGSGNQGNGRGSNQGAPSFSPAPNPSPFAQDEDEDEGSNPAAPGAFSRHQNSDPQDSQQESQQHPNSRPSTFNSDFTVFAEVNKHAAYVGEPILVDYYVYDLGGIRQLEIKKWPNFNGFWKEDLELVNRYQFEDVLVKGQRMRRAFLGRFALYAIKPGKLAVDKLVVTGRYVPRNLFNADDDMDPLSVFMGGFGPMRTGTHASQDLNIEVLPLPEAGRPANFGGAVGQFQMKLQADKTNVPAHTPINLSLTISGKGNFQAIDSMKLPLPKEFELYESNASSRGANPVGMRRPLESQKSFQYVVIPRKAGTFQIPPISWSYFDPEKKAYQTLQSEAIHLDIAENANASDQGSNNQYLAANPPSGEKSPDDANELRYLKKETADFSWQKIKLALLILFGAINAWLLFVLVRKNSARLFESILRESPLEKALENIQALRKNQGKESLGDLEEVILSVVEQLLGSTNPRGMTRFELESAWRGAALPFDLFQKTSSFLDKLDQLRFSDSQKDGAQLRGKLFQEAEEIIKRAQSGLK